MVCVDFPWKYTVFELTKSDECKMRFLTGETNGRGTWVGVKTDKIRARWIMFGWLGNVNTTHTQSKFISWAGNFDCQCSGMFQWDSYLIFFIAYGWVIWIKRTSNKYNTLLLPTFYKNTGSIYAPPYPLCFNNNNNNLTCTYFVVAM